MASVWLTDGRFVWFRKPGNNGCIKLQGGWRRGM